MPSDRPARLRFRDIRNTSTFRLTLLLGLVAVLGVFALSILIYALSARELDARSDRILRAEASRLAPFPSAALPAEIRMAIARSMSGLNYYGLLGADGRPIAGNLRGSSGFTLGHTREIAARPGRHGPIRMLGIRAPSGQIILIGRDVTPLVDLRWRVTIVLLGSGVAIGILILIAAVALSLAPLRRVDALQRAAHEIAAGRLDERMPILGRGDELDLFANTVNAMVEEVGRVVAQVKSVTDAVAHDLRTPLTRVRSHIDRIRRQGDLPDDVARRIDRSIADLDAVLERFAALLRISELEAGGRRAGFGDVALDPLLMSVVELYEPLADERSISLSWSGLPGTTVYGDQNLLFEAISNLVDNAIKFAPVGGQAALSAVSEKDEVHIEVRDNGPGISPDQQQSVLRRFDRGDASDEVSGSGLGLSVVTAIVHLHQFVLSLHDANPGLIVRMSARDNRSHGQER